MAKKPSTPTNSNSTKIKDYLSKIEQQIKALEDQLRILTGANKKQLNLLLNTSTGLYEEMDKLSKKAPAETVTNLALKLINDVIKETKQLVQDDPYIQRLNEFIPAGDNPENRDVLLILRTVQQGLIRFRESMNMLERQAKENLSEAQYVRTALKLHLKGEDQIQPQDIDSKRIPTFLFWFKTVYHDLYFDFDKLDEIDIVEYFSTDEPT